MSRTPRYAAGRARALGLPTRGTTAPNRLRRNDSWLCDDATVRSALAHQEPLVIDLGFGASAVTTVELAGRLRVESADVRVLGLEIDGERVAAAKPSADPPRLDFARGGFEFAGHRPDLVRAMNVLRQYDEGAAMDAWRTMAAGLAPGGVLVEGTCDELGRVGSWVLVDANGPISLTLSCAVGYLDHPATLAERLPKALIHHNVPGHPVHALIVGLGRAWDASAPLAVFSARQRWAAAVDQLATEWPVLSRARRHRLGEVTVAWSAMLPATG